jgi:hypothetical protein
VRALLIALLLVGCDRGDTSTDGCHRDQDCPRGRCVVGTGVCVDFVNPLDAGVPDLASSD